MDGHLTPIRILNVIRFPIGGIRSYLRYTYSRLDPNVYCSTIVTIDRPEAQLLPAGMAPLPVEMATVAEKRAFLLLLMATRNLVRTGDFDVIHSQGMTAAIVSDISARLYGVPHVVTLHETFRREQFSGMFGALKRRFLAGVLRRAQRVITVSQDARANLFEHLLQDAPEDHVKVIQNGVAVDMVVREAAEAPPRVRKQFDIDSRVALLGFVGRFMPEKGFAVLIEAVHLVSKQPDVPPFVVVAVNDGAYLREYRQQVAELGLSRWFHFMGFQSAASGTLVELDAVVMPSLREACPLVAMEAMVLGCPLIASDCIGLRELTAGSPALQFASSDAAALAAALRQFLADRVAARQRALDYVGTARSKFDSSRAAADLVTVFTKARLQ